MNVHYRTLRLQKNQPLILVVEDDLAVQMMIENALDDGGFEPAITASGEEAVTLLKGQMSRYRALVADIALRGRMTGWEVATHARLIDPGFPVLYITGAYSISSAWPRMRKIPE
jgi:CheY-like chemotaxis protein